MQYSLYYKIDGKYGGPMPYVIKNPEELHVIYYSTGLVKLPELSEGLHSLTVCLETGMSTDHIKPLYVDTVDFAVDTTFPSIGLLSPENKTYTTLDVPLNFTISEEASDLSYCLDGNDTAIAGNTKLTALSIGTHNLSVSARDAAGNAANSQTVFFTVTNETQTAPSLQPSEPFPTVPVAASSTAAAAGSSIGAIVYAKKRKRRLKLEQD